MTIYVICPKVDGPTGGVHKLYRHVDILNKQGWPAFIVQASPVRYPWAESKTPIITFSELNVDPRNDYLLIPEIYGPDLYQSFSATAPGVKKVIFNQNCYYTFSKYPLLPTKDALPYLDQRNHIVATLVVSKDSEDYLRYLFPDHPVMRIVNSVDTQRFSFQKEKKKLITFMPRKGHEDLKQVLHMLALRGVVDDYQCIPIDKRPQHEVAKIYKAASIFLSFSTREGFGLPPVEAMSCGALVIGYTGQGGDEYFDPSFSYPIPTESTRHFAQTVEGVIKQLDAAPNSLDDKRQRASDFVQSAYSIENEERSVLDSWRSIMMKHGGFPLGDARERKSAQ